MNFWKTLIITVVIYLGLNTVFMLVAMFTNPLFPTGDVIFIITSIFAPIFVLPGEAWISSGIVALINTPDLTTALTFIGLIIPPLVAVIAASLLADTSKTAFGAWLFTALLSCVTFALLFGIGQGVSSNIYIQWSYYVGFPLYYGEIGVIVAIFITGVINALFYGCATFLISREGI